MADTTDPNYQKKAQDYQELYKHYKQLENDMKAYNDELQNQFRKQ